MANKFITALFGDYSKKEVKRLGKTKQKVLAWYFSSRSKATTGIAVLQGAYARKQSVGAHYREDGDND